MNYLSDAKACEFADILDEYEAMIVTANLGKRDTMDDIREAMRLAGLKGADLSDEMTRFRDAVKDRRLIRTNPEKAERKEKNRDGTVDYLFVLTEKPSRTREGVKSALVQTEVQTPHDADGVIIEQNSCGSAEGSAVQTESTLAGQAVMPYPAAEAAEKGTTVCAENDSAHRVVSQPVIEPGPQDTKAPSPSVIAVPGKIVEPFYPDPSNPRVRNIGPEPEMPAFLKRATTDQVGRA